MDDWNEAVATEFGQKYGIYIGESVVLEAEEITPALVKQTAGQNGIKWFAVNTLDGEVLVPSDFPYEGDVRITKINKAG